VEFREYRYERRFIMAIFNLILFGAIFYLAFIGIPAVCDSKE
jgi:hypothetical protein